MRRKHIFVTGMVTGICMAASVMIAAAAPVSEEEAKQAALDAAGVQEEDVTIRVNTDRDDGREIYEIQFWKDSSEEYEFDILADTGEILEASYEQRGIADGKGEAVSLEEAKALAAEHAGLKTEDAVFVKEESDRDDGRNIWELEFFTEDQQEYEYEIDSDTGLILSWSYDGERHLAWKAANPDAAVTEETAAVSDRVTGHHTEVHHEEEHHADTHHD